MHYLMVTCEMLMNQGSYQEVYYTRLRHHRTVATKIRRQVKACRTLFYLDMCDLILQVYVQEKYITDVLCKNQSTVQTRYDV